MGEFETVPAHEWRYFFMATTLRDLLIQRAARLQDRPALTTPDWGTLSYARLRHRAEGVALGLLALGPPRAVFSATGTAWDWAAELAAAASGLAWEPDGLRVPTEALGGPRFNDEEGRGPYHAREEAVAEATPFSGGLAQGELVTRLRRLNVRLSWDHTTDLHLPLAHLAEPTLRAALWSALYAGAHVTLGGPSEAPDRFLWRGERVPSPWDPGPFLGFWTAP
jgi:hypothetical protein